MADVAYVGCGVLASAAAMDKGFTKCLADQAGIRQANYLCSNANRIAQDPDRVMDEIERKIGYACFVKPSNAGSSVGISKCANRGELKTALELAARFDERIVIEEAIIGREFECSVLGNEDPCASSVGEIIAGAEFYDYNAKYIDNTSKTVIPAQIQPEIIEEIRRTAVQAFQVVGGSGLARVDFFVEDRSGVVIFNEINTMPGFTRISMYPMLWLESGLAYAELLERLIDLATASYKTSRKWKDLGTESGEVCG